MVILMRRLCVVELDLLRSLHVTLKRWLLRLELVMLTLTLIVVVILIR